MEDLTLREASENEVDDIINFINNYFLPNEPINKSIQLSMDGYRMPYFDRWLRVRLEGPRNVTLVAVDGDNQLMGVLVATILSRGEHVTDPEELTANRSDRCSEKFKKVLDFLEWFESAAMKQIDEPEERVDCAILSCRDDRRIPGLGTALLNKMQELARAKGIKYQTVLTTSFYSARICQKLGFEEVFSFPYTDYKVDGKVVFDTEEPHTHSKFWLLKE